MFKEFYIQRLCRCVSKTSEHSKQCSMHLGGFLYYYKILDAISIFMFDVLNAADLTAE